MLGMETTFGTLTGFVISFFEGEMKMGMHLALPFRGHYISYVYMHKIS